MVVHFKVLHLIPDVMHAITDTKSENRDTGGAGIRLTLVLRGGSGFHWDEAYIIDKGNRNSIKKKARYR